ncbi:hypothetical protein GCK72_014951 [Caenorhabditis remanei]|uniref:Uncharacterized protein n=1 Tax=Caenorhabditis remanei TaxID=31234 RepID=A0A6A5GVS2_CAERE|nr:hypothetical protein GCK72_014951 [Caenorhabditis remanei]KAF1758493.1 hypothetical protein GCK72_014951 [Caenorhabditis remanei]
MIGGVTFRVRRNINRLVFHLQESVIKGEYRILGNPGDTECETLTSAGASVGSSVVVAGVVVVVSSSSSSFGSTATSASVGAAVVVVEVVDTFSSSLKEHPFKEISLISDLEKSRSFPLRVTSPMHPTNDGVSPDFPKKAERKLASGLESSACFLVTSLENESSASILIICLVFLMDT